MEFWDSFWATMWGALAGALVGAVAAYAFGRDLSRRERAHRLADEAVRRDSDEAARYRALIPMHVTRIVEALHRYADELSQVSPFGVVTRPIRETAPPPPRHTARAQVMAAIDAASVDARGEDRDVFSAVREAVSSVSRSRVGAGELGGLIDTLVAWQMFDPDSTGWAIGNLRDFVRMITEAREAERPED